jgi:hypothetical protein
VLKLPLLAQNSALLFLSLETRCLLFVEGMDMISLEGKTNFFEKRVAEYQKSGVMASLINTEEGNKLIGPKKLNFDADF